LKLVETSIVDVDLLGDAEDGKTFEFFALCREFVESTPLLAA